MQQENLTVLREDQARALSQNIHFLSQFVAPSSPSEVAQALGMPANLAHHHARKLEALGLLFEQRRETGRVYYQLSALEFRHAHALLPIADPDENMVRVLRETTERFRQAHARSWRLAEDSGSESEMVYGFGETRPPRPDPSPAEARPPTSTP